MKPAATEPRPITTVKARIVMSLMRPEIDLLNTYQVCGEERMQKLYLVDAAIFMLAASIQRPECGA
jgi:hypothetical protein